MTDIIRFEVKDWSYPDLEKVAEELALFVHRHKSLMEELNTFMRISGPWWKQEVQTTKFQQWKSGFIRNPKKAAPDKVELVEKLYAVKKICKTPQDWDKMRGLIPEKLFELYFDKKHGKSVRAYGAQVLVHGESIVYREQQSDGTFISRRTVDAGSWDGSYGEFAEVKFHPERFEQTDIGYLNLLEDKLNGYDIDHGIFLVSFHKDISFVRSAMEGRGILPKDSKFGVLGSDQFV